MTLYIVESVSDSGRGCHEGRMKTADDKESPGLGAMASLKREASHLLRDGVEGPARRGVGFFRAVAYGQ